MIYLARALRTAPFATRLAPQFKHGRIVALARRSSSSRLFATSSRDEESDPIERAAALLWEEPVKAVPPEGGGGGAGSGSRGRSSSSTQGPSKGAQALRRIVQDAKARHAELLGDLEKGNGFSESSGRELAALTDLLEQIAQVEKLTVELADLAELAEMDPDMQDDVAIEVEELSSTRATLGKHLLSDLMNRAEAAEDAESREKNDSNSSNSGNSGNSGSSSGSSSEIEGAILEVRCGTGGDEAAMFASEILDMYLKFAKAKGWPTETLSIARSSDVAHVKGLREASVAIKDPSAYHALKWESGVHRVQRVPINDVKLQTSAATVAVLADYKLPPMGDGSGGFPPQDLRIDLYRAQGAGGQHVNTTESAVRITHLPTGVVVAIQDERSQHQNKAKALRILQARILDAQQAARDQARASQVQSLVGRGDRSERIRTYNFPQDRVTDHRLGDGSGSMHGVERLMMANDDGDMLDELIGKLEMQELKLRVQTLLES